MGQLNLTIAEGGFVRDPELRTVNGKNGDTSVLEFTIACETLGGKKSYKSCVAWGKTAERIAEFFHKGKPIRIHAAHYTDMYEKDGVKVYKDKFMIDKFDFVNDGKPQQNSGEDAETVADEEPAPKASPAKRAASSSKSTPAPSKTASPKRQPKPQVEEEETDDIPF